LNGGKGMKEKDTLEQGHVYMCSTCNAIYDKSEFAKLCEHTHMEPSYIFGSIYEAMEPYPSTIGIKMPDRKIIKYYRKIEDDSKDGD